MAVIKDGNGGTDQASVGAISKALRVTLFDTNGNPNSVPLATSSTGALESNGNIQGIRSGNDNVLAVLLSSMLTELRIQTQLLAQGFNLEYEQVERWRNDPEFSHKDTGNLT
jgi:hypothetical protein